MPALENIVEVDDNLPSTLAWLPIDEIANDLSGTTVISLVVLAKEMIDCRALYQAKLD